MRFAKRARSSTGASRSVVEIFTEVSKKASAAFLQADDFIGTVVRHQARADIDRCGSANPPCLDDADLGRAAADIDIEQRQSLVAALLHRPRTMRRHDGFQRRSRGGADELTGFIGEQFGDLRRIITPRGLAGDNHRAGIDIVPTESRRGKGFLNQFSKRSSLDVPVAGKWRQQDRRARDHLALQHQRFALQHRRVTDQQL